MDPEEESNVPLKLKTLTDNALDANKAHQHALTKYVEQLTAEMQEMENLMSAVTTDDIDDDEREVEVIIPGATKAMGPCPISEFLNPFIPPLQQSPFFEHASRRSQYMNYTIDHPMKSRELDALAEAVKSENLRLQALESQRSGQDGATIIDLETNTEGINWRHVAEKVSNSCATKRTADQCRIRWLGDRHPRINHSNWSGSELDNLKALVSSQAEANDGKVDWVKVSEALGTNRTPIDCMRRGIPRQRHVWHPEADERLAEAVKLYGTDNWSIVARYVSEHATAAQCSGRYSRAIDPSRKRGPWTPEELERLKAAVAAYGNAWVEIAACIPGRTNEQCRERWMEVVSHQTSVVVQWTEEHDKMLVEAVASIGNRWTAISAKIANGTTGQQNRTENAAADAGCSQASSSTSQIIPPKGSGRPRKDAAPSASHSPAPASDEYSMLQPRPRPVPRPLGKGKGKAKAIEPDDMPEDELAMDVDAPVPAPPTSTNTNASKRMTDVDMADQAPAAKKRKVSSKNGTISTKKKVGRPKKSSASTSADTPGEDESQATPAAEEPLPPRPKPRPRGRPKKVPVLPAENAAADGEARSVPPFTSANGARGDGDGDGDGGAEGGAAAGEVPAPAPTPRTRGRPRKAAPTPTSSPNPLSSLPSPEHMDNPEQEQDAGHEVGGSSNSSVGGRGGRGRGHGRGRGRGRERGGRQGAASTSDMGGAAESEPGGPRRSSRKSAAAAALQGQGVECEGEGEGEGGLAGVDV
ncbi:hypothetical protein DXG03_003485 [Asterophora parasitica]|uniref:Uncharacterized protein n=1 Tax=Asterophora parasitica TaxID=117018 RepID=A0A9P7GFM2_9AGAR|nr:hypothetical protein DXG03_003485 [Asterophora parasitica]